VVVDVVLPAVLGLVLVREPGVRSGSHELEGLGNKLLAIIFFRHSELLEGWSLGEGRIVQSIASRRSSVVGGEVDDGPICRLESGESCRGCLRLPWPMA